MIIKLMYKFLNVYFRFVLLWGSSSWMVWYQLMDYGLSSIVLDRVENDIQITFFYEVEVFWFCLLIDMLQMFRRVIEVQQVISKYLLNVLGLLYSIFFFEDLSICELNFLRQKVK